MEWKEWNGMKEGMEWNGMDGMEPGGPGASFGVERYAQPSEVSMTVLAVGRFYPACMRVSVEAVIVSEAQRYPEETETGGGGRWERAKAQRYGKPGTAVSLSSGRFLWLNSVRCRRSA